MKPTILRFHQVGSGVVILIITLAACSPLSRPKPQTETVPTPTSGSTTFAATPTLSWTAVPGAARYELQIANTEAGVPDATAVSATGTSYTPTTALEKNATYYWRVRAVDESRQTGAWSTIFSLKIALGTISGLAPASGTTTFDTTPTLSWTAVPGAARYELQIANTQSDVSKATAVSATGTSYTPSTALANNATHHWRVRAVDASNQAGAWSTILSLKIALDTISGPDPASGTTTAATTPTLSWTAVPGAARYELQIANTEGGVSTAPTLRATGTSYTPSMALANNATHYWRVRAVDASKQPGAWSTIFSLRIAWGAISGLGPASGTTTAATTPTLSWTAVPGAAGYQLQIANTEAGVPDATAVSATGTSYTPTTALEKNATYYWRVRAVDESRQTGAWSTIFSLKIALGTISGLAPASGTTTFDTTPTLSWTAVPGAARYELQIANTEAGVPDATAVSATGTSYTPTTALANNATHHWRVRAVDASNQAGAWSKILSLKIALGTIGGRDPASGSTTADTTPTLSWTAVPGAARYELQIANTEGSVSTAPTLRATATSYTPSTALASNATHYWRVRAVDASGQAGEWSTKISLQVIWGAISGVGPASGTTTFDTTPTLSWTAVPGAARYELQIANTEAGVPDATAVSATGTSYTPTTALANNATHHWRVRAVDASNQAGAWSKILSLKIALGTIGGRDPASGSTTADTTPTLSWTAVPGAARYELQIANTEGSVSTAPTLRATATSYTPSTALASNATHYWRVRAVDASGQAGEWSTKISLQVIWGAISGPDPASGSTTADTTPTLSWTAVPGAARYELQIADTEAALPNATTLRATGPSYTPTTALTFLKTYYWRVKAIDGREQSGAWSSPFSLKLDDGFVSVAAGAFSMGTAEVDGGDDDERPVRSVTLSSFRISPHEVTQQEYEAVAGTNPSDFGEAGMEKHPVEQVSWYDAVAFCNKLSTSRGLEKVYAISGTGGTTVAADFSKNGYRLPTEAEWEYAARGGSSSKGYEYSGSDTLGDVGWYTGNSDDATHPVGGKQANELGLFDMSGNVDEWCWDRYATTYDSSAQTNPTGPLTGPRRVTRGGNWYDGRSESRVARRSFLSPDAKGDNIGFRICRSAG